MPVDKIKVTARKLLFLIIALLVWGCAIPEARSTAGVAESTSAISDKKTAVPDFELPPPQNDREKSYLGVSGGDKFKARQINSKVLIIEVFSMYCPHCQHSAPKVNELYETIEGRPDLKGKIKMIGIGIGNSSYEVNVFREKYKVVFPLFPDQDMTIGDQFGVKSTPTFIGVRFHEDGNQEQFYFKAGGFGDAAEFLAEMVKLSGIE